MSNIRAWVATPALLMILVASGACAQYQTGDVIVSFQRSSSATSVLLGVTPAGSVYTVAAGLPYIVPSVMPAPDNRSLWFSGHDAWQSVFGRVARDGTVTSFYRGSAHESPAMDLDGGGVVAADWKGNSIIRVDHANRISTIYSGAPISRIQGGGIDLVSGDFIFTQFNGVYRADVLGRGPISTVFAGSLWSFGLLHTDPTDGSMLQSSRQTIQKLIFSPSGTGAFVTLVQLLSQPAGALDRDPTRGDYVFTMGNVLGQVVMRLHANPTHLEAVAILGQGNCGAATVAGSRHLCPGQPPVPGGTYSLLVSSPAEPGASYVVALSFSLRPAIKVGPKQTVYLFPDTLFHLSLGNSGIFSGFQGRLNTQGEAIATVRVPAIQSLRGIRFFAACMTLVGGRVGVISDTIGTTIR